MLQERLWITYLVTVLVVGLATSGGGDPAHRPVLHVFVHAGLLAGHVVLAALAPSLPEAKARVAYSTAAALSLPVVFSGMGWLLPAVHPEPFEWTWIEWDRALFGTDPTVALQAVISPDGFLGRAFTELLQWIYGIFYLIPIAAVLLVGKCSGGRAYDRAMFVVVFGFLVSYLGYLLWPTLPPYRFLDHGEPIRGLWLAESIHTVLDAAEANRWDCFPSGHTMLSLVSLWLVWRDARRWFWVFLPVVLLLVFSTMALRYHYFCDVAAGILFVVPALWAAGRLWDRA